MLKMKNFVMVTMIVLVISLLFVMGFDVNATDAPITLNGLDIVTTDDDTNAITANQIEANAITANQIIANEQAGSIIQPITNTTTNTGSSENTLPQTGVTEDITVMFFIIVCVVSAVYAYRKIKHYNI